MKTGTRKPHCKCDNVQLLAKLQSFLSTLILAPVHSSSRFLNILCCSSAIPNDLAKGKIAAKWNFPVPTSKGVLRQETRFEFDNGRTLCGSD
uniref:Uncharacterized protein n=1 Tax=Zea mays TaxID=4577 RepID=A0A804NAG9_MAIZE